MLTVHHLANSRSQRVLWMLEELGVPYAVQRWERGADMMAPAALRRIHSLGKSPVLVDDDRTLAETGLILTYLSTRYGHGSLAPPGNDATAPERLDWLYWLHYAEGCKRGWTAAYRFLVWLGIGVHLMLRWTPDGNERREAARLAC